MGGKPRLLIESIQYEQQFNSIGNPAEIDEALLSLTWAIASNPYDFPIVPGFKYIRLAKTDPKTWQTRELPTLRIWFKIEDKDSVLLHWIEVDDTED